MSFDALVLDASLRQSLVAVRSLGRRGLRVAAAGRHHKTPAISSRWCRQGVVLPPEDAPGPYLADLEAWLEHAGARVARDWSHGSAWHSGTRMRWRSPSTRSGR